MDWLGQLPEELDVIVALCLLLVKRTLRLSELIIFFHRQIDVKLEQRIYNFIHVLVDTDQIIVNQVPLS